MTMNGFLQISAVLLILLLLVRPLGRYMSRVYQGEPVFLQRVLGPVERLIYRLIGVDPAEEMGWKTYAGAMLLFNLLGLLVMYLLLRLQALLPLNPQGIAAFRPDLAFNTAVSFTTNTNWQNYGGETGMSYLIQMLGPTAQNFISAGTGMAILAAFIRGFKRQSVKIPGQLLGRLYPHEPVHPAAAGGAVFAGPGLPGCGPDLQPFPFNPAASTDGRC